MKDLATHVRRTGPPAEGRIVVRGSPNTVDKFMQSASRMASQFVFEGQRVHGISVHVAVDEEDLDRLLASQYATRHHYRRAEVQAVLTQGFVLLPTFKDEHHFTVLLSPYTPQRVQQLLDVLSEPIDNPYYTGGGER